MNLMLVVLGIGLMLLGLSAIPSVPWLGWIDLVIGVLAIAQLVLLRRASPRVTTLAMAPLGLVLVGLWVAALVAHEALWPGWWNLAFGAALFMAASGSIPRRPADRR
jgi:hypothetical protein